ncbi:MAG: 30S ribosomal protein S7 [Verrucomicrobia bacterium]|nr:30S ribosomal protein S7 [Verrucomicrobiota bacterium]
MARRRRAHKRVLLADPKFESDLVGRLIAYVMKEGRKSVAEGIVYGAIEGIRGKVEEDPLVVLAKAVDNVKPRVEVRSRRVGGATYQVPVEVNRERQVALAMRWLISFSSQRKGVPMRQALALEVLDAYKSQGNAVRKREDTHKMAQANKAFAHYAW